MAVRYVIALSVARAWCLNGVAKGVDGETMVFGVRHRGGRVGNIVAVRATGEVQQQSRAGDAKVLLGAGEGLGGDDLAGVILRVGDAGVTGHGSVLHPKEEGPGKEVEGHCLGSG